MNKGIVGKKLGMTQIFMDDGSRVPVTVVQAGPCVIVQKKTEAVDGYAAVQLGFEQLDINKTNTPLRGHFNKTGKGAFRYLKEFRMAQSAELEAGSVLSVEQFVPGDFVDVTGTSIGKGFQGVVKRYNYGGGRASHGSRFHRAPGAIGCSATPARVFKNKGMPGQMGNVRVTVQRLQVVRVDADNNLLLIKGAVPGAKSNVVFIKESVKKIK
ncbi:MAG: 50S ribosomal protein L3 [Trichlorobacter sp.]|nr:50S ribosomal protein L3 [Trichlorobacter sp.]